MNDTLVKNEADIKKYLSSPTIETLEESLLKLVKQMTFLTAENFAEVLGITTNLRRYYENGMKLLNKIS